MHGLLAELKRRRVFRVAGLYGVVSWVIAEAASVLFPALLLPEWSVTLVVAMLACGFPIALVLAWAYDIGPGGIERTAPQDADRPVGGAAAKLAYGLMLLAAVAGLGWFLWSRSQPESPANYDSIAVMPFANLSGDAGYEYFSDGMAEELLNLLAKVPGLQVAARTSSFALREANLGARELGERLGVEAILEGSVRRAGEHVRITAQLVDSRTGYHLWSETYDREMQDIFAVQDEISGEIVKALKGKLAPVGPEGEAIAQHAPPTDSVEAYQVYLQARHQWKRRGAEPVRRSIELFEQAIAQDPDFARAWAGLAAAHVVLAGYTGEDASGPQEKAADAARQALARDPNLAEAHAVLAQIQVNEQDWTGAEGGFFFATSLDPNDSTSHHWYSGLLMRAGRLTDALEEARKAYELDPASPVINLNLAEVYIALGYDEQAQRYARAAQDLGTAAEVDESVGFLLAWRAGDMERFAALGRKSLAGAGWPPALMDLALAVAEGRAAPAELQAGFEEHDLPQSVRTSVWTFVGDEERAMEALLASAEDPEAEFNIVWLPEGRDLRQHPRFGEFARKVGLVAYWKQYGMPDDCRLVDEHVRCGFATVASAR